MDATTCATTRHATPHAQTFELDLRPKFSILLNYNVLFMGTQVTEVTFRRLIHGISDGRYDSSTLCQEI